MSATACVSAADPLLQHQILSCICVNLSVTLFAMYAPVVVLESAASITPPLYLIAAIVVPIDTSPVLRACQSTLIELSSWALPVSVDVEIISKIERLS